MKIIEKIQTINVPEVGDFIFDLPNLKVAKIRAVNDTSVSYFQRATRTIDLNSIIWISELNCWAILPPIGEGSFTE